MDEIPIEILCKYYARLYTLNSDYNIILNKNLNLSKNKEDYLPFIKVLYEGLKLKAFPLSYEKILYRASLITIDEINKIKEFLKNKKLDLPCSIMFSKSFISFSKDKNLTEEMLKELSKNKNFYKVVFLLENDDKIGYNLSTHADLEELSFYPNEKEVLFFPFSSFEIIDLKKNKIEKDNIYEIKLQYLGKYLKDIEKDNKLKSSGDTLPESEFRKQLIESGLIQNDVKIDFITKDLTNQFKDSKIGQNK